MNQLKGVSMASAIQFTLHNKEQASPALKEALDDLPRLAALASKDTGWPIKGILPVRVVNSSEVSKFLNQDALERIISVVKESEIDTVKSKLSPTIFTRIFSSLLMGAYLPGSKQVIVANRDRNKKLTADYYKSCLYHELIHVAQDQNHPELFKHMTEILKEVALNPSMVFSISKRSRWKDIKGKLISCGSIVEGHPFYLQRINDKTYFPEKNPYRGHRNTMLRCCAMYTLPGVKAKLDQYKTGADFFETHPSQAPEVDQFYDPSIAEIQFRK